MLICANKLCRFAHSDLKCKNLKYHVNRSVPFKYFDRLSRFNRGPVFDHNMQSHSQVFYGGNALSNNPRTDSVPKNLP